MHGLIYSASIIYSGFLFFLLAFFSGFNYRSLLSALIFSRRELKDSFRSPEMASEQAFFCYLNLEKGSDISRVVVVLVTIVTPHVEHLRIPRRLAYTTGNRNSFFIIFVV
jgi:hypothetical protein